MKKYLSELKQFLKIGLPIYGSQASYTAMGLTDTIVAGRAGSTELSGVAIGASISNPLFFSISGIMFALTPIIAHLYGGKKISEITLKMREVIWIGLGIGIFLTGGYIGAASFVKLSSIDSSIIEVTSGYLKALAFGACSIILFTALRCFSEGLTQTKPVFFVAFFGMLLNIPADIILVNGLFGFPELGGVGCGYATSFISTLMLIGMVIVIMLQKDLRAIKIFSGIRLPQFKTFKELIFLGLPIGLGIFVELSMFSGAAIILGPLGDLIVASHAVALSIASFLFMVPLSIGLAAATRVGNLLGAEHYTSARFSSYFAIYMCFIGAILNILVIVCFKDSIVGFFTNELDVAILAKSLLILAAIFQLSDGIQMGALGGLRGYKDTFVPMIYLIIAYWIFALPIGYYLTYYGIENPLGAHGMWIGMIFGLSLAAIMAILRLKKLTKINPKLVEF